MNTKEPFFRWRPHPWHGLSIGPRSPDVVEAFIELTTFDAVKFEVDKETGFLRVDRPQKTSVRPPALYGFIPRTYCAQRVCDLSPNAKRGDGDPLDICVISEQPIDRAEIILSAVVIGGLQMVDDGEADDKIIAVLENDNVWGSASKLEDVAPVLIDRLRHYFMTYKALDGKRDVVVEIDRTYDAPHAKAVIEAAAADYDEAFGVKAD